MDNYSQIILSYVTKDGLGLPVMNKIVRLPVIKITENAWTALVSVNLDTPDRTANLKLATMNVILMESAKTAPVFVIKDGSDKFAKIEK